MELYGQAARLDEEEEEELVRAEKLNLITHERNPSTNLEDPAKDETISYYSRVEEELEQSLSLFANNVRSLPEEAPQAAPEPIPAPTGLEAEPLAPTIDNTDGAVARVKVNRLAVGGWSSFTKKEIRAIKRRTMERNKGKPGWQRTTPSPTIPSGDEQREPTNISGAASARSSYCSCGNQVTLAQRFCGLCGKAL